MLSLLLGYETLRYAVVDQPHLVDAICEKVTAISVELMRVLADSAKRSVIWVSDDLGFRTGTIVSLDFLRAKILPWQTRCAEIARPKDKPYLIQYCGNIDGIIEELILYVGIDGKHSFEDAMLPVTEVMEAKRR